MIIKKKSKVEEKTPQTQLQEKVVENEPEIKVDEDTIPF